MNNIKKLKWIYFIIYLVLMVTFMQIVDLSIVELVMLFGIALSVSLYSMAAVDTDKK